MSEANGQRLEWFCVRSHRKQEHIAAGNLRKVVGLEVLNPRIRFRKSTRRGPVWTTEPVFPSYLFARFDEREHLRHVEHTSGVASVVQFGLTRPTLAQECLQELRSYLGEDEIRTIEETLQPGDTIEISGGVFHGLKAVVCRLMPAKARVAVLLNFLGRDTHTDVALDSIVREGPKFLAKVA